MKSRTPCQATRRCSNAKVQRRESGSRLCFRRVRVLGPVGSGWRVLSGRELVTHAIAEFVNAVGEIFAGFFAASWSEQHPDTHPDPDSYEQSGCSAHSMVIFATNRFCGTAYTPGG